MCLWLYLAWTNERVVKYQGYSYSKVTFSEHTIDIFFDKVSKSLLSQKGFQSYCDCLTSRKNKRQSSFCVLVSSRENPVTNQKELQL